MYHYQFKWRIELYHDQFACKHDVVSLLVVHMKTLVSLPVHMKHEISLPVYMKTMCGIFTGFNEDIVCGIIASYLHKNQFCAEPLPVYVETKIVCGITGLHENVRCGITSCLHENMVCGIISSLCCVL